MATRFLRRRSMRLLMGQSGSNPDLQGVIDDVRSLRDREKDLIAVISRASESQLRWAYSDAQRTNGSRALQEIIASIHELQSLIGPASEEYLESLHALGKAYRDVLDQDRQVERQRRNVTAAELKSRKLQTEVERRRAKLSTDARESLSPSTSENETRCVEVRAQQAREAATVAQRSLAVASRDCAYTKLVRVRAALTRVCDARLAALAKEQLIVEAEKALLALLPDAEMFADATGSDDGTDGSADSCRPRKTLPSATKNIAREIVSRTHAAVLPHAANGGPNGQQANGQEDAAVSTLRRLLRESTVSIASTSATWSSRNNPNPVPIACASFACTGSPANASRTTNCTSAVRLLPPKVNALNTGADVENNTDANESQMTLAPRAPRERSVLNLNVAEGGWYQSQVVRSASRAPSTAGSLHRHSLMALPSAPFASASASPSHWAAATPLGEEDRVEQLSMRQSTVDINQSQNQSLSDSRWRPTFVDSLSYTQPRTAAEPDDYAIQRVQEHYLTNGTDGYGYVQSETGPHGTPC